jgi:hypothetical protein
VALAPVLLLVAAVEDELGDDFSFSAARARLKTE